MQPTGTLSMLADTTQSITFSDGDGVCSVNLYAKDVVVTTNSGNHNHGSSKVKLKNLVDYNWEPKFYSGQLLTIHMSGKYLAYSIKAPNPLNPGTWTGMVRVVYNPEPGSDRRSLIKGMKGEVQDLAFAHIENEVVLACIDEQGNLYVHEIEVTDSGLRCTLVTEVREDTGVGGDVHRVVWCPYIPAEDDAPEDDVTWLLLTTHSHFGRVWNLRWVSRQVQKPECRGLASELVSNESVYTTTKHTAPIVDASFSPDGSALATASADGYVMFFELFNSNEGNPRCLHNWQPHEGQPLSCLFFLDNHNVSYTDDHFWKFAVTGAFNNTTFKVWSCKSWTCIQTITFTPSIDTDVSLGMKAMLDISASYLLLSNFKSRSLYVLNMTHDKDETIAYCKTISEFLLPYPVLSFCIADAEEEQEKCESRCDDPFHSNGSGGDMGDSPDEFDMHREEVGVRECSGAYGRTRVRLYIVHPKGLQEGELVYSPPMPDVQGLSELTLNDEEPSTMTSSILQQQTQQLKNLLMRSQVLNAKTQPGSLIGQRSESPSTVPPQLNLMTPDAFSSPGKREEDDPPLSTTPDVAVKQRTSTAGLPTEEAGGEWSVKLTSGGSSPSREVQQIMAHSDNDYKDYREGESSETPAGTGNTSTMVQNGSETIYQDEDMYTTPERPTPVHHAHSNSDTSWPQISLAQINEANQRKASSDKSSSQSLNASLNVSAVERASEDASRPRGLSPADRNRLESLEHKLELLTELMSQQNREIRSLRGELSHPRELVEEALLAHTQRTSAAIESALADGWERISRVGEAASARAGQAAGVGAARALEPLAAALQHELATKLSATDHLLRENIEKLANSKMLMERLSSSIASSLTDMVRASFREAILKTVVPLMEAAQSELFKQLSHSFLSGTKEYAENTQLAARAAAERGSAAAVASLRAALDRHTEALTVAASPPHQEQLTKHVKETVHGVLEKELVWWREQARSVAAQMSRAHSPATPATPHASAADRQMQVAQIQSLMSSGDINGAFQLALSASDLTLVVVACRTADPMVAVAALKQHVLLSLVQQLAADMGRDTHLKQKYLEEAIMNLDPSNPVTREHLPTVIHELKKQIVTFVNSNPGHTLTRQFRMLLLATEAFSNTSV